MSLRDQGRTDDVAGWMRLNESLVKERDALAAELAAEKELSREATTALAGSKRCAELLTIAEGRIRELEEQRDAWKRIASDELPSNRTVSETPDAMRARIVTETADAIAAQSETPAEQPEESQASRTMLEMETSVRCPMYWGSHDKMCLLVVGHIGDHVFPTEASKIMTPSDRGEK